ncbi:MAG: DNA methyltransferase [Cyanobacteria bacterium]|nr:DNA methyltransferase [Cyanobacteriota bacterium]
MSTSSVLKPTAESTDDRSSPDLNQLRRDDRAIHDWYRFVLAYPPHLVQDYLQRFGITSEQQVLDPFCGTGTTIVECKKLGIPGIGVEANPMAWFAGSVKLDWEIDPNHLLTAALQIGEATTTALQSTLAPLRTLSAEEQKLMLKNSISPLPLHKTLVLREQIDRYAHYSGHKHLRLALAKALVTTISNLRFGPEVSVGKAKTDAAVVETWLEAVQVMVRDLQQVSGQRSPHNLIYQADSRQLFNVLPANAIDAVITSPPYPNEKDYTRATRLESVLLGFIRTRSELRAFKQGLVRSNTRNIYKTDTDHLWVSRHPEIQRIAAEIEARRIALGKTSGFERMYHRAVKLYFGGMARHLADLRHVLRPDAQLAYVVGDQKSYLQVMIPTGTLLADLAAALGYDVVGIDLFRTRMATATKEQMREEVVILRWPGVMPTQPYPFMSI